MNYWKPADLLKNDLVDNIIGQDGLSCTERLYSAYTVQFTEYFSYCRKLGSAWTIYLGKETQSGPNVHEVSRKVSQVIVHPDYNNSYLNNDIALMKLSSVVSFTDYIKPICLAGNSSQFFNSTICWATGWGKLSNGENPFKF